MDLALWYLPLVAFAAEFVDNSLGMGYGTILSPLLLLLGFPPLMVVPAILFSEFWTDIAGVFFHHRVKNVNFTRRSLDTRVALVFSLFSAIGAAAAVILALKLPAKVLKAWIGALVTFMGLLIFFTRKSKPRFSWSKVMGVGALASFNKGMSGGGYGPLLMGGQILSGIGVKNALGITAFAEGVTCLVALAFYFFKKSEVSWSLVPWLTIGAVLAVPFAARFARRVPEKKLTAAVATVILILGLLTLAAMALGRQIST